MKWYSLIALLALSASAFADDGKLSHESQAGIVITNGNTHTQNFNLGSETKYAWERSSLALKGNYLRAASSGVVTSLTWLVGLRYEFAFTEKLGGFTAETLEGDQFAGILQRYNTDLGVKYYFQKREHDFTWFGEGGYRYTSEHATTGATKGYQKARLYTEAEKYFTANTSAKLWIEYVPNFTISEQWLLNSEISLSSALNSTFAIKTAYDIRYNHAPVVASAQNTDSTFSTSLVAKF